MIGRDRSRDRCVHREAELAPAAPARCVATDGRGLHLLRNAMHAMRPSRAGRGSAQMQAPLSGTTGQDLSKGPSPPKEPRVPPPPEAWIPTDEVPFRLLPFRPAPTQRDPRGEAPESRGKKQRTDPGPSEWD
eukprot:4356976-Pleurochrysis_carterae.AAC.1